VNEESNSKEVSMSTVIKKEYSSPTLTHQGSVDTRTLGFQTTSEFDGGMFPWSYKKVGYTSACEES
jgi:hypothetical protein